MAMLIETNIPEWMTNEALKARLQPLLPDVDIRYGSDLGDRSEILMLTCVRLPAGLASTLPNLKLIQKLGAGVETMVNDPDLPPHVRVTRLKPEGAAREIAQYCASYVLKEQQNMRHHSANQINKVWGPVPPLESHKTVVGVLGLGHIGGETARTFAKLNFKVVGWSRSPKEIEGVDCRYGHAALDSMLAECDFVASVLPSTAQTRGLFDLERFKKMKPNAMLINVGRGDLINDKDLIEALDQGYLKSAVLDVFHKEPLPTDHPFWEHPQVTITPHVSGWHVDGAFDVVAENYRRLVAGESLLNEVDRASGY